MARRLFKSLVVGSLGAASLVGLLSGGISHAAANCAECDLLRVETLRPENAALGRVGGGNLRDGINIASIFNRPRDFDHRGESPMAPMLDPRRNPYLTSVRQPTEQAFLFAPWATFSAPQAAAEPGVLFPVRVQPFWSVSQGYSHLNTSPWAVPTFGNPELRLPTLGRAAL